MSCSGWRGSGPFHSGLLYHVCFHERNGDDQPFRQDNTDGKRGERDIRRIGFPPWGTKENESISLLPLYPGPFIHIQRVGEEILGNGEAHCQEFQFLFGWIDDINPCSALVVFDGLKTIRPASEDGNHGSPPFSPGC